MSIESIQASTYPGVEGDVEGVEREPNRPELQVDISTGCLVDPVTAIDFLHIVGTDRVVDRAQQAVQSLSDIFGDGNAGVSFFPGRWTNDVTTLLETLEQRGVRSRSFDVPDIHTLGDVLQDFLQAESLARFRNIIGWNRLNARDLGDIFKKSQEFLAHYRFTQQINPNSPIVVRLHSAQLDNGIADQVLQSIWLENYRAGADQYVASLEIDGREQDFVDYLNKLYRAQGYWKGKVKVCASLDIGHIMEAAYFNPTRENQTALDFIDAMLTREPEDVFGIELNTWHGDQDTHLGIVESNEILEVASMFGKAARRGKLPLKPSAVLEPHPMEVDKLLHSEKGRGYLAKVRRKFEES